MPFDRARESILFCLLTLLSSIVSPNRVIFGEAKGPRVMFKTTVFRGHLFVTWSVDKQYLNGSLPINYSINYCLPDLDQGGIVEVCKNVTTVCNAVYDPFGSTGRGTIRWYPENILAHLKNTSFDELRGRTSTSGPFVKGNWDEKTSTFSCGIFLNRCMDGQARTDFSYRASFNGTLKKEFKDINLGDGAPVKPENISVQYVEQGCCFQNMTVSWQIIPVCTVDIPTFNVWLTQGSETVFKTVTIRADEMMGYSYEYAFAGLISGKNYTFHIESLKRLNQRKKTYVKKSFTTPDRHAAIGESLRADLRGFLYVTWPVESLVQNRNLSVVYNISWCLPLSNSSPFRCKNNTTICTATYNGTHGAIQSYRQNVVRFAYQIGAENRTYDDQPWVTSSWDNSKRLFTCGFFQNTCSTMHIPEQSRDERFIRYDVCLDGYTRWEGYSSKKFTKGFAPLQLQYVNITNTGKSSDPNDITATVQWRVEKICASEPPIFNTITLYKDNKRLREREINMKQQRQLSRSNLISWWSFKNLEPHSEYVVRIYNGEPKQTNSKYIEKSFWTVEGVPIGSPTIEPIADGKEPCIDNKRNVTVKWKLPPVPSRNGIIRYNRLVYWMVKSDEVNKMANKAEITLKNVTSTELIGLECDVEYKVQVISCIRQNSSCSEYSTPVHITARVFPNPKSRKTNTMIVWISIAVGSFIVLVVVLICLRIYSKKRRQPLENIPGENVIDRQYTHPDEVELSAPGDLYDILDGNIDRAFSVFDNDRSLPVCEDRRGTNQIAKNCVQTAHELSLLRKRLFDQQLVPDENTSKQHSPTVRS